MGDLIEKGSASAVHMGEDLVFAAWNMIEAVPDAVVGNFEAGKKITTTVFDNGQVVIDYLTDILPTGDAWLRVHAANLSSLKNIKLPILYNINMPEYYTEDTRWQHVRNTPFRKTIETLGAILADAATIGLLGKAKFLGEDGHKRK